MPTYIYTAKDQAGKTKVGNLEAGDQHDLAAKLRQSGLILISAKQLGFEEKKKGSDWYKKLNILNRISLVDKMMFTKHLAVMTKAGLSISQSLKALSRQTKNPKFKKIINQVKEDVRKGEPLSESMAKHPKVFHELYVNMVKVGETSGTLETVLRNSAEQMRKDNELVSRAKGAMIYPAVVIATLFGIGILMMTLVVPKLTQIFVELKIELPLSTRIVIGASNFIKNQFLLGVLLVVGFVLLIKISFRNITVKRLVHKIYLHLPIFGKLIRKVNSARFARTFSSLIVSGVDIVKSLQIVSNTLGNLNFKESLKDCAVQVQKGKELSDMLAKYEHIYPAMVIEMVQVGEKTGDVAGILSTLADFYEEEIDRTTENLSSVLEPVIMIVIGSAVGFFAISMLQPMYSMIQGI